LYLFITFSGLATGPLFFGEPISWAYVFGFAAIAILGFFLVGFGMKAAVAARTLALNLGRSVMTQSTLAIVLSVLAVVAWSGTSWALWGRERQMDEMRAECAASRGISACEAVCRNDSSYEVCKYLMGIRTAEFEKNPDDASAAAAALDFTKRALETGCFTKLRADDCITLGDMERTPGLWQKANLEKDSEEAMRYYGKACFLKDERGCRLAQEMAVKHRPINLSP
jgi:hypothetical protein